jgi:hypothetical protein
VSNRADLASVLRRIAELLDRDDAGASWSGYELTEPRANAVSLLAKADRGQPLDEEERRFRRFLFLPTGPLQETSIRRGWGTESLAQAARFDEAV